MGEYTVLKVAHIVGSLNIGGAERFVIDLCETQKNNDIQPIIISLGTPGEALEQECEKLNTPVFSFKNTLVLKLIRVFLQLKKCDVVHIHSPHALKFVYPILSLLSVKIIYTRHGAAPLTATHWVNLHKKANKYIDAITFVSQEGLENFHRVHQWDSVPNYVIDNGVLIKPVDKKLSKQARFKIGSVGRMIPLKNQISLLRAVTLLPKSLQEQLEVHFFGDGGCLKLLQAYDTEQNWQTKVVFHGMVNDRNIIYSSFDLLAVTSETEGLSMVIIEAMANKIPVVATNVGGNPKLVIDDTTGYLFDYNDDDKLAQLLSNFLENQQSFIDLGEQAFAYIQENFSLDSTAKKYAQLYQS